ncbi:Uncharacterised protein [Raoultella terrigena]|uniref:Lon protease AAA domain-containing protein n=1 Tax=Raoultella terrigena TaxID=577 RepID=A0A4U9DC88_RAOTE|nr:Uncharacterised protein [Raoultella terrigena]
MTPTISPFMLVKAPEEPEYLQWLAAETRSLYQPARAALRRALPGLTVETSPFHQPKAPMIILPAPRRLNQPTGLKQSSFLAACASLTAKYSLQPGLVHRSNGGVLIIALRALLAQPLLWMRLKNIVTRQRFDWLSIDESRPLPVSIPSMPLNLKIILVGERDSLADFQDMEPELSAQAIYSEYEDNLQIADGDTLKQWCQWVWQNAQQLELPGPAADAWPLLIQEGARYNRRSGNAAAVSAVDCPPAARSRRFQRR